MQLVAAYWGEIAGLLAAVMAAVGALLARSLGKLIHPVAMNAVRCSIAAVCFVLIWALGSGEAGDWRAALPWLFISVMGGMIVGDSLYLAAITRIGPGRAAPLAMSFPIPTLILSVLLMGETVSVTKVAGILIGVTGIWLIATPGRRTSEVLAGALGETARERRAGTSLAIGASISWGVSIVAFKPALDIVSTDFANVSRMVFAGLVLGIASRPHLPGLRRALKIPSMRLAALASGLAGVLTTWLLAQCVLLAGSSTASLLSSMTPVFAAPMAWLIFGERLTLRLLLGIVLGIVSIIMVTVWG